MPFDMGDYIQAVEIEGTVYVGGGADDRCADFCKVMTYDISSEKWATLPPYRTWGFAMVVINNQLVLVGGDDVYSCDTEHESGVGVWDADNKRWTYPYPKMPTGRTRCSAVVHNEWLVVAGGLSSSSLGGDMPSSVEVMNTNSKQWYVGPPMPEPWYTMRAVSVGDECYFMDGYSNTVYSLSLSSLMIGLNSSTSNTSIWKKISGLQTCSSTPLSISGACSWWEG